MNGSTGLTRKRSMGGRGILAAFALGAGILAAILPGRAAAVKLDLKAGEPVVEAGRARTAYVKVALTGGVLPARSKRPPANVSIVIDKSGSMSGEKIEQARRAAILAIERLSPDDVVSVVAYDNTVTVLVPATKVSDRERIREGIEALEASGSTALFAGVSKGAEEARKFMDRNRVNRVILLSDGQANVGPSQPHELGRLGASFAREGLSVSTIGLGLGYNEDLMTELALKSDGNHAFVEEAEDLAGIFDLEFRDVLSVVAQDVRIEIKCEEGFRPVRVLGRDAEISGRHVLVPLNQLYASHEKYILLEVEIPAGESGSSRRLGEVTIAFDDVSTRERRKLDGEIAIRYSSSKSEVERNLNKDVMVSAAEQIAAEKEREAVKLRDEGKVAEAQAVLQGNAVQLEQAARAYSAPELSGKASDSRKDAAEIGDEAEWNKKRKELRESEYKTKKQQTY